jgi:predicted PurR-regulated permease PerM
MRPLNQLLYAAAAGVVAGVIYAIIWAIVDRGSVWRLIATAVITFVVALVLRYAFTSYFTRRRS